jgi:histidine ammonia-lyase
MTTIRLDGHSLTVEEIVRVARLGVPVELTAEAQAAIHRSTELLERLIAEGRPVYGVTTGFGALDTREVSQALRRALQRNLILSHACGVGASMPPDAVRGMMVIRANCLAQGLMGVRPHTVEALLAMLNRGIVPVVPEKGSVCACGDLAPLAHMVLPLIGMGEAEVHGRRLPGGEALAAVGLAPITLDGRDGLALINGTEQASSLLALAVWDAAHVLRAAEIAAAMTHEALGGVRDAFDARVHAAKPFATQAVAARHLRALLEGSRLAVPEARPGRLRDALSLRCTPQVLGAAREGVQFATRLVEVEVNAANDNPLLFPDDGTSISNSGNFHGQYVGMAADVLGMAVLCRPTSPGGLPGSGLAPRRGLEHARASLSSLPNSGDARRA